MADSRSRGNLKREWHAMPDFMTAALNDTGLMSLYHERPAYQQNDYVWWIASPKREVTRTKRLEQMLDELKRGDVYMGMAWRGKSG